MFGVKGKMEPLDVAARVISTLQLRAETSIMHYMLIVVRDTLW